MKAVGLKTYPELHASGATLALAAPSAINGPGHDAEGPVQVLKHHIVAENNHATEDGAVTASDGRDKRSAQERFEARLSAGLKRHQALVEQHENLVADIREERGRRLAQGNPALPDAVASAGGLEHEALARLPSFKAVQASAARLEELHRTHVWWAGTPSACNEATCATGSQHGNVLNGGFTASAGFANPPEPVDAKHYHANFQLNRRIRPNRETALVEHQDILGAK